ncbi:MAG: glycosyltransferase family 4 protein [Nanoarchaeota archaeon]|nr:glycosyltransferase family 4 protein [Nanoarchaeota archaeon]
MKSIGENSKKVLIYPPSFKLHTAYKSLISNPPKGYDLIVKNETRKQKFLNYLKNYKIAKIIYSLFLKIFKTTKILELSSSIKESSDIDLVFSTGYIYSGRKSYVIDIIDNIYCLAGYNYDLFIHNLENIKKSLLDNNCKKIICVNKASLISMKNYFPEGILKKTVLIYPAIKPIDFKKIKHDKFRMLFMGSINNPDDFGFKGGLNALEIFEEISKKYENVELVIRSKVPSFLRERILSNPKIVLMEKDIKVEEVRNIYLSSDILLCPAHTYIGLMTLLESMSFKLPIVALDTYATREFVRNGFNGFIIKKSEKIKSYFHPSYPTNVRSKEFISEIRNVDKSIIRKLVDKVELLINNPKLVEKMGENGRKLIDTKFSIDVRKKKLGKIFDDALGSKKR